jgi:hypothetical protein
MSLLTQEDIESAILFNACHDIEDRKIACGVARSRKGPYLVESPLASWLIGGQTMQGKSSIATFFVLWFLVAGTAHILLLDPHKHNKARGLYTKLAPLYDWFIREPIDCLDVDELLDYIDWLEQEYHDRRRSMIGKKILLVVIDEFNELLTSGLTKKQAERIATVIGNVARGGSKHGVFVVAIGHNFDLASAGGNAVRRNILGRVSVLAELGEMSNILDTSDRQRLKKLASSPRSMRPGDAIVKVPGYGIGRLFYPYISAEYLADFAQFLHCLPLSDRHIAKNGLIVLPDTDDTPPPIIKPVQHESTFPVPPHSVVPTVPTASPTVVTEEERRLIIQEATKQLLENGKVVRLQIKKALGWNSDSYAKIKLVCDELGWHKDMQPQKISTEQKQAMKKGAVCVDCGTDKMLEIDHIFPRSLGGPSTPDNLAIRCKPCNQKKGANV